MSPASPFQPLPPRSLRRTALVGLEPPAIVWTPCPEEAGAEIALKP